MSVPIDQKDRFRGCLIGLAVGDAVGTAVEFQERGSFAPVIDMIGGGPFHLKPGEWTDDTSMALCLATSLIECQGFDARDQMNRYLKWYETGYLSSNCNCFDIGPTVLAALIRYKETGDPFSGSTDLDSAGNGSLMRLAPVVMFYFPERERILHFSAESSRTTHGAAECVDACFLFGDMLFLALGGADKEEILFSTKLENINSSKVKAIANGEYRDKAESEIQGTGHVVKSLEAALWCFWLTDTFESAILKAANLGEDADTTAAVCGQIAGAFYGESGIPKHWLKRLVMREEIGRLAELLRQVN
jgi:ADP-ribosyl-[dinitrogen reductase] hydrolase